jgi:bla regulator protein BlaR1
MNPLATTWTSFAPLANHLWQSTMVAALCGLLAILFRHHRAQVRHWLWLVASLKFAVPFAGLVAIGRELAIPFAGVTMPVRAAVPAANAIVEPFTPVMAARVPVPVVASSSYLDLMPSMLLALWFAGTFVIASTWAYRWMRLRALVTAASTSADGREISLLRTLETRARRRRAVELRLTSSSMEPGVFGILRPVLLWPAAISARLDEAQIEAILAHELAHLKRHDNLKATLHMIVQAVFWFHPVVWWIGGQLVAERERACDEAVIQLGSDPETYAESILTTCAFQIESPLVCVAGVTGADLKRRIEQIMDRRVIGLLSLPGKLLLACAALFVIMVPVFAGTIQGRADGPHPLSAGGPAPMLGPELHEYSWLRHLHYAMRSIHGAAFAAQRKVAEAAQFTRQIVPPAAPAPASSRFEGARFEVASIKPFKSDNGMMQMQLGVQLSRFTASGLPLRQLIMFAYGLQPFQIEGGPSWLTSDRWEIVAKIPDNLVNVPTRIDEMGPANYMLRTLLAERFKLVIERTTKDAPIYELQVARADGKLGPKLTISKTDCADIMAKAREGGPSPALPQPGQPPPCGLFMGPGNMGGGSAGMTSLARALSNRVGRTVIDKTGLTGNYDFTFDFAPDFSLGGPGGGGPPVPPPGAPPLPPVDPNAPTIFTALQEQLGLKLEAKRGPVDTIIIKSVELPSPD